MFMSVVVGLQISHEVKDEMFFSTRQMKDIHYLFYITSKIYNCHK